MTARNEALASSAAHGADPLAKRRKGTWAILESPKAVGALVLATIIVLSAVFFPWIAPYDPASQNLAMKLHPPSWDHLLGTDQFGRDILSRIIHGGRIPLHRCRRRGDRLADRRDLGLVAGYKGGWLGMLMMAIIDVLLGFRTYLLAIMVVAILGPSTVNMLIAIGLAMFPEIARITRAEVLSVKERDFVTAAFAGGANHVRILFRHVAPQILAPLIVVATFNIANAIIVEASLSFLGLGPAPPTPAWGLMISEGRRFILGDPWIPAIPGFAIMLTVLRSTFWAMPCAISSIPDRANDSQRVCC